MFYIKYCSFKLFFSNWLDALGSWESFLSSISLLLELLSQEIKVYATQGKEKYSKNYFQTNISYQEYLFKEFYAIDLTQRPSFLVKVGYMTLTSLLESSRADIDFFLKDDRVIVYVSRSMYKLSRLSLVF